METLGLAASAAGGGMFGLLGTVTGRIAAYLETRQAQAQERARWAHELDRLDRTASMADAEARAAADLADREGAWRGLDASLAAEAALASSYRWVDAVRGLTRPVLTLLLWLIAAVLFGTSDDMAQRAAIVETATFAATAATLWWFGDRAPRGLASPPGRVQPPRLVS